MSRDCHESVCTECGHRLLSWPKHEAWARLATEAVALGENFYSFSCRHCGAQTILSYVDGVLRYHDSLAHPDPSAPPGALDRALGEAARDSAMPDRSLERLRQIRERLTAAHRRRRGQGRQSGPDAQP